MANLRRFYKWTTQWIKMMHLAQKRGRTWGCKHRKRFLWLQAKIKTLDEKTLLKSLDQASERRLRANQKHTQDRLGND